MSIGFGSSKGAGVNDRIIGPTEAVPNQFSFHVWTFRTGEGSGTGARIFERNGHQFSLMNNNAQVANTYAFGDVSGGASPAWEWARPAANTWAPIGLSVDTTNSVNDPVVYQSGVKLAVGSGLTQRRANAAYSTSSSTWNLGNISGGSRAWEGMLAEMAWWSVILTDAEFRMLQQGVPPDQVRPEALMHHFPLAGDAGFDRVAARRFSTTGTKPYLPHPPYLRHRAVLGKPWEASGGSATNSVGSASGSTTVSGVGASIASASGSSSGTSTVLGVGDSGSAVSAAGSASGVVTVSGVGAAVAEATGSASGSSSVSGVGASVAGAEGSSSGSSTVSGVGDFTLPGSAVGTALGTSSASGVGASTVSTQGVASGSATVSGVGDSIVPTVASAVGAASGSSTVRGVPDEGDSLGGDDAILIYEEPKKKKRKPKKSIEDILGEAIKAIAKEAEPIPAAIDRLKESPKKEIVRAPVVKADPVEQFRAAEEEAQKVSALLAQYQEEVKRREFEEDEELIMLIAMEML